MQGFLSLIVSLSVDGSSEGTDSSDESDGSDDAFNAEFRKYKANYYQDKMDYEKVTAWVTNHFSYHLDSHLRILL